MKSVESFPDIKISQIVWEFICFSRSQSAVNIYNFSFITIKAVILLPAVLSDFIIFGVTVVNLLFVQKWLNS